MLQIVFLILKILGIGLLALITLLLLLIFILLFVPVRYRGEGSFLGGKLNIKGDLSWLFRLFSLRVRYDGELGVGVRVFGIPLFSMPGEKKERKAKKSRRRERPDPEALAEEAFREEPLPKPQPLEEKEREALPSKEEEPRAGFAARFTRLMGGIKQKLRRAAAFIRGIAESREKLKAFLDDPENQALIKLFWSRLKRLARHTLPRRVRGRVRFGADDPYMTGKILTYAAFLYPVYGRQVLVEPVFDRAVFEAEGSFKGRIRMIHLAAFGAGLIRNRRARSLLKAFLNR